MADDEQIETTTEDAAPLDDAPQDDAQNGIDHETAEVIAQIAATLDPTKPMWHLVAPALQRDIVAILKTLPYQQVAHVMPALMNAPLHQ